jgi:hypothetical protein
MNQELRDLNKRFTLVALQHSMQLDSKDTALKRRDG